MIHMVNETRCETSSLSRVMGGIVDGPEGPSKSAWYVSAAIPGRDGVLREDGRFSSSLCSTERFAATAPS